MLSIALFGPPAIEVDGVPIQVDTRKATALLAYLTVEGTLQSRDHLSGLLWPEYDQERARAALRRTLSALKRALQERWLSIDRSTIRLSTDDVYCDVTEFNTILGRVSAHEHAAGAPCTECIESLLAATDLAAGDFMSGFTLRDSAEFEEWQSLTLGSLRQDDGMALERLVDLLVAAGDLDRALERNRRWLVLDRLHEPAHRHMMRLLTWAGNRNAALEHYRDCVALFERELGVTPLEETTELYEAIREDRLGPSPAPSARVPSTLRPEMQGTRRYPLVGRAEDFEALWAAYSTPAPRPRLLVIEGEAGIGKTALAEEFTARVASTGATVAAARGYEEEQGLAYGPVAEALGAVVDSGADLSSVAPEWRSEAARLTPGIDAPPVEPHSDPGAQARFLEGTARCLAAGCVSNPSGVLFLDDAQWADAGSLDVISFLLRRIEADVCVLLTFRTEDVAPGHRLRRLLADTEREGRGRCVSPARLGPSDVAQLVQSVAPAASAHDPGLVTRLYQETEGVPYFIVEYLTTVKAGSDTDWAVPRTVRDLVMTRVQASSELARQVLAAAAVIGRSFDFDGVREASGRSEDETVVALEELSSRSLVVEVPADLAAATYDFVHEKVREVVYEDTSLARRRILHGRVGASLAKAKQRSSATIAHHLRAAGRDVEAASMFEAAGRRAASLFANAEARDHFHTALGLGHPDHASLHEALGDLDTLAGAYGDALTRFETAAALGDGRRLPELERKLAEVHLRLGDYAAADSHLKAALDLLDASEHGRARILADRSLVSARSGNEEEARSLAAESLHQAEKAADTGALAQAHNILGILDKRSGQLDDSLKHLEQSLAIAESLGDPSARVAALNNLALVGGDRGDTETALERAEAALSLCLRLGDRHREAALHNNIADLLHRSGRGNEAMSHLKQGAAILAEVGEPGVMHPEVWKLTEW